MSEKQGLQYGVRGLDGRVTAYRTATLAREAAERLNRKAREIHVPGTARVVRRHVLVTTTTQPWEEVQ